MTSSHRFIRAVVLSVACLTVGLVGAQPAAAATKTYGCSDVTVAKTPEGTYGGYFTNISARGSWTKKSSACKSAYSLVQAYYKCRRPKGVKGTCHNKTVNGLKCRESNRRTSPSFITATVTCTKGSKRIKHNYQQGLRKP